MFNYRKVPVNKIRKLKVTKAVILKFKRYVYFFNLNFIVYIYIYVGIYLQTFVP